MNISQATVCNKGHTSKRRKNGNCIECEKQRYDASPERREYARKKQAENRIKRNADPTLLAEHKAYMRTYAKTNKDRLSALSIAHYHRNNVKIRLQRKGIQPTEEILDHIENHNGTCDLCNALPNGKWKELTYDHCHTTGVFRGLLCDSCNRALGFFKDNASVIEKAAAYVKHYQVR